MSITDHMPRLRIAAEKNDIQAQQRVKDQLAIDQARYLEAGGTITEVPFGMSGERLEVQGRSNGKTSTKRMGWKDKTQQDWQRRHGEIKR